MQKFDVLSCHFSCDWLRYIDRLFVYTFVLGKSKFLAYSEHSAGAILMVTSVVAVAQAVLVLSCSDHQQNSERVREELMLHLFITVCRVFDRF